MRPGGHSKSYFTGPIRLYDPEVAHALGLRAAIAFQHIHYLGLDSPDGWVGKPMTAFAAELGFTDHNAASRALGHLVAEGVVEKDDRQKIHRYRIDHNAVEGLFPHRVRTAARGREKSQGEMEGSSHSETKSSSSPSAGAESPLAPARARAE